MSTVNEMFGSLVFNEQAMKERLPKDTYKMLKRTIDEGKRLQPNVANIVANAMKDWAIEKGATHFTHWFQPMTGTTAEKHDSFISPTDGGGVVMEFSGKELIKGEPDASSFPSGGLRATFEARGYTTWDPSSHAFIKDNTLYIPCAFYSYGGEALDKKTPLLRSMEILNKETIRLLHLIGETDMQRIVTTVGVEQEYFLLDIDLYNQRKDLQFCHRTLFGAQPPKGQELDDHYFGNIKPRVRKYMRELNEELWKLGIYAKTEHNEVAPSQHELAPIFTNTNLAVDHNQLTMDIMQKVARRNGFICLLHEKPYAGINGSGKHNNWSLSSISGANLLDPGPLPRENKRFLLFFAAVIKAVDEYQDLLRISVASAGNDHRLGGHEAPPAILSVFVGTDLEELIQSIVYGKDYDVKDAILMKGGVHTLPRFEQDLTDRNRTSPFAFTGNKFEFRMPGSNQNVADPNTIINTIVTESLSQFSDLLEKDNSPEAIDELIKNVFTNHKRIIFNGNNYSEEWKKIAKERGLLNLVTTPDALPYFLLEKNIKLFEKHNIFTQTEAESRYTIMMEDYNKKLRIESGTMADIAKRNILPGIMWFLRDVSQGALAKKQLSDKITTKSEELLINTISDLSDKFYDKIGALSASIEEAETIEDIREKGLFYAYTVTKNMNELRELSDKLEGIVAADYWPFPRYDRLLYSLD